MDHAQTAAGVVRQIRETIAHILAVYRDNATLTCMVLRGGICLELDFAQASEAFSDRVVIEVSP